jgi:hypothetical protein
MTEVAKLKSLINTMRPGMLKCAVGFTEKEGPDGIVLTGGKLVGVPLTADGLPQVKEVIKSGWDSFAGTKINVAEDLKRTNGKGGSKLLGRYQVPMVISGEVRYVEGALMAFSQPTPHLAFSPSYPSKWNKDVPVEGKPGKTESVEMVSYRPLWGPAQDDPYANTVKAMDQDFNNLLGEVIGHQMGIELV